MTPRIPFNRPYRSGREEAYLRQALASDHHCGNGPFTRRCVELMQQRYGYHEVFLTTSCTQAMEMGAILADLQPGDEVILPSWTFASTANAIVLRGARPVFCDADRRTMNIDVDRIEGLITDRTRMILPIDYAGIPCEIEAITEIAERHGLIVMQDAAQSLGSVHRSGAACGAVPPLAAVSFHESKNLSCGEGGALVVGDPALVERARIVQEKGTDRSLVLAGVRNKYGWADLGSSFLLSDLLAAILLAQLEAADAIVERRARVTAAYRDLLRPYVERGVVELPVLPDGVRVNHHALFVIFDREDSRTRFLAGCRDHGVYPYIGYVPLHSYLMGRRLGWQPEDVPLTEELGRRIVRLPLFTDLGGDQLSYGVESMGQVLREIYG